MTSPAAERAFRRRSGGHRVGEIGHDAAAAAGEAATTFSIYLDRNSPGTTVAGELYDDADTWFDRERQAP